MLYLGLSHRGWLRCQVRRVAGGDGERDVLMVGSADEDGVDIFAVEQSAIIPGGEDVGPGELFAFGEVVVPDVANGGEACSFDWFDVAHEGLGALRSR